MQTKELNIWSSQEEISAKMGDRGAIETYVANCLEAIGVPKSKQRKPFTNGDYWCVKLFRRELAMAFEPRALVNNAWADAPLRTRRIVQGIIALTFRSLAWLRQQGVSEELLQEDLARTIRSVQRLLPGAPEGEIRRLFEEVPSQNHA